MVCINIKKVYTSCHRVRLANTQFHCNIHLQILTTLLLQLPLLILRWNRVDLKAGFIRLRAEDTKTGEGRAIPLNNVLTDILKHCIRHLHHDYVFTHNNEQVKYSKLRYHFEKAVKKAGIEDFTIHDLRHTCITNWRRQGHDYFKIMKASGHRTMNVFKRYNTVDEEELKSLAVQREEENRNSEGKSAEK